MVRQATITLFLVSVPLAALTAQASPQLTKGRRIRVTIPVEVGLSPQRVTGRLQSLEGDTLVLATDSGVQALALTGGSTVERSLGRRGVGLTALLGAAVGLVTVTLGWQSCGECEGGTPASSALLGVGVGAGVGAILGSILIPERWQPVETSGVRIVAAAGGIDLRASKHLPLLEIGLEWRPHSRLHQAVAPF